MLARKEMRDDKEESEMDWRERRAGKEESGMSWGESSCQEQFSYRKCALEFSIIGEGFDLIIMVIFQTQPKLYFVQNGLQYCKKLSRPVINR